GRRRAVRSWLTSLLAGLFRAGGTISPVLIGQIKNIRFTNQSYRPIYVPGGVTAGIGWGFRVVRVPDFGANAPQTREHHGDFRWPRITRFFPSPAELRCEPLPR